METTGYWGAGNCVLLGGTVGCGTAFGLSPPQQKGGSWTETVLYSFQGDKDGHVPHDDLVFDKQGNIYGATTPRLAILHHKNSNRGFVHDVPPSLIEPKTHLRVAHHPKEDITTAVCSSRKSRVATLSTASRLNRTTWTLK